ncbi:MAG: hypothetical protein JWN04_6509 [Myxococcaceae bacterium]|nr:hypothetical protein [Myxococcaceae bacterium]
MARVYQETPFNIPRPARGSAPNSEAATARIALQSGLKHRRRQEQQRSARFAQDGGRGLRGPVHSAHTRHVSTAESVASKAHLRIRATLRCRFASEGYSPSPRAAAELEQLQRLVRSLVCSPDLPPLSALAGQPKPRLRLAHRDGTARQLR